MRSTLCYLAIFRYLNHVIDIYSDSLLHLEASPSKPIEVRCLLNNNPIKEFLVTFPLEIEPGHNVPQIHLKHFVKIMVIFIIAEIISRISYV